MTPPPVTVYSSCVCLCASEYLTTVSALPVLYPLIRCCSDETARYDLYMKLNISAPLASFFLKELERFGRSDSGSFLFFFFCILIRFFIHNHSCGAFLILCYICGSSVLCVVSRLLPTTLSLLFCNTTPRPKRAKIALQPTLNHLISAVSLL